VYCTIQNLPTRDDAGLDFSHAITILLFFGAHFFLDIDCEHRDIIDSPAQPSPAHSQIRLVDRPVGPFSSQEAAMKSDDPVLELVRTLLDE
jgi:hypothetical protein